MWTKEYTKAWKHAYRQTERGKEVHKLSNQKYYQTEKGKALLKAMSHKTYLKRKELGKIKPKTEEQKEQFNLYCRERRAKRADTIAEHTEEE
jgi:uncharacterized protein YifE (UPF0438 family)